MSDPQTSHVLQPSFWRASRGLLLGAVVVTALTTWHNQQRGLEWALFHWITLLSGAGLIAIANWLRFVPPAFEWSQDGCIIQTRLRGPLPFSWQQLERFETASRGLFLIQFAGPVRFQVLVGAFKRERWQKFQDFLVNHFPGKRYSTWERPWPKWR